MTLDERAPPYVVHERRRICEVRTLGTRFCIYSCSDSGSRSYRACVEVLALQARGC